MPQSGQIIPSYNHPHAMTYINDNTEVVDPIVTVEEGPASLFVYASPRGRDNVLLKFTSAKELLDEHGPAAYRLYGQPHLNAHAWMSANNAKAYAMRVTPDDATYANAVVLLKAKATPAVVDGTGAVTTPGTMEVRHELVHVQDLSDVADFEPLVEALTEVTPDVDGFVTYPIAAVRSLGRGEYGNALRARFSSSRQMDKENEYKNFMFDVFEMSGVLKQLGFFTGACDPESVVRMKSNYLVDKVNDPQTGSNQVSLYISEDGQRAVYELYKSVDPTSTVEFSEFDMYGFMPKGGSTVYAGVTVDAAHPDAFPVSGPEGFPLNAGSDGQLSALTEAGVRDQVLDQLYLKAFSGEIDRRILSKFRTPLDFILDAGYSAEVKRELIRLIGRRGDAYGYIDGGQLSTLTEILDWADGLEPLADRLYGKEGFHYKTRDPFTGRPVVVTTTYHVASKLPTHIEENGRFTPFVGETYSSVTNMLPNSLLPVVDADDLEAKEELYERNVNYYQQINESVVVRATQETSQSTTTDLSEENNMQVLLQMKRILEEMNVSLAYSFAEASDRANFVESANEKLKDFLGTGVRSFEVKFDMTPFEEERMILHCYLSVVFRTMTKRQIIEIDVNRRV